MRKIKISCSLNTYDKLNDFFSFNESHIKSSDSTFSKTLENKLIGIMFLYRVVLAKYGCLNFLEKLR